MRWFLLNASPDVRDQVSRLNGRVPAGVRHVPVEGILATDAELDHTLGIALLREARNLQLLATAPVLNILRTGSRIVPVTEAFAQVAVTELPIDRPVELTYRDGSASGLTVTAFTVPGDPPRFAPEASAGHTVGLQVTDERSGGTMAFVPGCGALSPALLDRLGRANLLLFDGTFWSDDELVALGISDRTARQMDHLPVSGPDGSLELLSTLPCRYRVYTHINNSNPMLLEDGRERRLVESAGILVGDDGMRFTV